MTFVAKLSLTTNTGLGTVAMMAHRRNRSGGGRGSRWGGRTTQSRGEGSARGKRGATGQPHTRALITVNEQPIRRAAINKCKYILRQFDTVAGELDRYENVDLPAHRSWYFRSFGPRLTEFRELDEEVRSYRALLQEIRHLIVRRKLPPHEAYRIAQEMQGRREQEPGDEGNAGEDFGTDQDQEDDEFGDDFDERKETSEEQLFALFLDMLRAAGYRKFDPDSDTVRILFDQFKASGCFGEQRSGAAGGDKRGSRTGPDEEEHTLSADQSDAIVRERLKSLYRQMAKELHPDNGNIHDDALRDDAAHDLWHRVQQAYAAEDLDELQMLAAHHSIRRRNSFADLPVSRILAVHRDRKDELRWIRRRHREAQKCTAWRFTDLSEPERTKLYRMEEEALIEQISALHAHKAEMKAKLESYRNQGSRGTRNRIEEEKEREVREGQLPLF